jgi:hypothetical protein
METSAKVVQGKLLYWKSQTQFRVDCLGRVIHISELIFLQSAVVGGGGREHLLRYIYCVQAWWAVLVYLTHWVPMTTG